MVLILVSFQVFPCPCGSLSYNHCCEIMIPLLPLCIFLQCIFVFQEEVDFNWTTLSTDSMDSHFCTLGGKGGSAVGSGRDHSSPQIVLCSPPHQLLSPHPAHKPSPEWSAGSKREKSLFFQLPQIHWLGLLVHSLSLTGGGRERESKWPEKEPGEGMGFKPGVSVTLRQDSSAGVYWGPLGTLIPAETTR